MGQYISILDYETRFCFLRVVESCVIWLFSPWFIVPAIWIVCDEADVFNINPFNCSTPVVLFYTNQNKPYRLPVIPSLFALKWLEDFLLRHNKMILGRLAIGQIPQQGIQIFPSDFIIGWQQKMNKSMPGDHFFSCGFTWQARGIFLMRFLLEIIALLR